MRRGEERVSVQSIDLFVIDRYDRSDKGGEEEKRKSQFRVLICL